MLNPYEITIVGCQLPASKDPEAATEKQRVSAEHEEVGPQC